MSIYITDTSRDWLSKILKMQAVLKLTIDDIPPSGNNYKGVQGKHWFIRPAAVKFKGLAASTFYALHNGWLSTDQPIATYVTYYISPKHKMDLDNHLKVLNDSFIGLIWDDDSQIMFTMVEKIIITPAKGQKVSDVEKTVMRVYC